MNMWQFFNNILDLLTKIDWKHVWHEVVKVPKGIKYALLLVLAVSAGYFGYTKFYTNTDISHLQQQVVMLDHKVSAVINKSDYTVDIECMITSLYILEELNDQIYDISLRNRDYIEFNMRHHVAENDYMLQELERGQDRIQQQHLALKQQLRLMINKFQPYAPQNNRNNVNQ